MTTGMRRDQERESRVVSKTDWAWGIVAVVVAAILIGYAIYSQTHRTTGMNNAPNATSNSVQNSASGQQGAVGNFAEHVNPGASPSQNPTIVPGTAGTKATGTPLPVLPNGQTAGGSSAGAGSTGISTATDTVGGARTPQMKGGGTLPSTANPGSENYNTGGNMR